MTLGLCLSMYALSAVHYTATLRAFYAANQYTQALQGLLASCLDLLADNAKQFPGCNSSESILNLDGNLDEIFAPVLVLPKLLVANVRILLVPLVESVYEALFSDLPW